MTTIAQIKRHNKRAGYSFFSPDTMAFFDTRIESELLPGNLFVTSEQPPYGPRIFNIHRYHPESGIIGTLGTEGYIYDRNTAIKLALKKENPNIENLEASL